MCILCIFRHVEKHEKTCPIDVINADISAKTKIFGHQNDKDFRAPIRLHFVQFVWIWQFII